MAAVDPRDMRLNLNPPGTAADASCEASASAPPTSSAQSPSSSGGGMKDFLDKPWADKPSWLLDLCGVVAIGCIMGAAAIPYSIVVDKVPESWQKATGHEGGIEVAANMQFATGSPWWILICWALGTAVGLLKWGLGLDAYPSFVTELKHQHVDPVVSCKVLVCCMASLCAGATLGLEAGLGAIGAALGHVVAEGARYVATRRAGNQLQDEEAWDLRRRTYILCGIAAAFGAILPAPFVSSVLVGEVANQNTEGDNEPGQFLAGRTLPKKVLMFLVPASTAAFMVKYALETEHPSVEQAGYQMHGYNNMDAIWAVGLGAIAAVVGLFFLLVSMVARKLAMRIGALVERRFGKVARKVALCSFGGLVSGVGICLFPLAYSSGKSAMPLVMKNQTELSTGLLVGTAIAKCFTFWIGMASGLVGGMFFPLMFVGLMSGEVCARIFGLEPLMAVPVMLAAVPASFFGVPLTMVALPVSMFVTGPVNTVPIFIGVVTSNTLLVGSGFLAKLLSRATA